MPTLRMVVEHDYPLDGGPGINVWHYRTATPGFPEDAEIPAAATILQAFYTDIASLFPSTSTLRLREQVIDVNSQEVYAATPWSVVGTRAAGDGWVPPSNAIVVNWRTSNVSRSGRGRSFFGPLSAACLEANGTPALFALTTLTTAANALIQDQQEVGNGAFGVYSPTYNVIRDFVSAYSRDQFAVLRSRRD